MRIVALMLLYCTFYGASTLLSRTLSRASILIGKGDSQPFHSTIEGGFVNAQFPRCSQAVVAATFQRRPDGLGVENVMG